MSGFYTTAAVGLAWLAGLALLASLIIQGYAGTIDMIALLLHKHARAVRKLHKHHEEMLAEWWGEKKEDALHLVSRNRG